MSLCACTGRCKIPPYTCNGIAPGYDNWRYLHPPVTTYAVAQGCICPPTSEKTCESRTCPRKDQFKQAQAQMQRAMETMQQAASKNEAS